MNFYVKEQIYNNVKRQILKLRVSRYDGRQFPQILCAASTECVLSGLLCFDPLGLKKGQSLHLPLWACVDSARSGGHLQRDQVPVVVLYGFMHEPDTLQGAIRLWCWVEVSHRGCATPFQRFDHVVTLTASDTTCRCLKT